jgi:hypothetical protein
MEEPFRSLAEAVVISGILQAVSSRSFRGLVRALAFVGVTFILFVALRALEVVQIF